MEPTKPNFSLQNAYEQINFYEAGSKNSKPVFTCSNGPSNLAGLFTNHNVRNEKQEQEIYMCAQPFYVGEVDHNIEQIGLMAVKEVRYVDDEQWEEMVRENQKYMKELQRSKKESLKQLKKIHAKERVRNEKGQFITKINKKKKAKKDENPNFAKSNKKQKSKPKQTQN